MNDPSFEAILEYLRRTRAFDFTAYKRASLKRRIEKRMQAAGVGTYEAYLDHLEVHPDEFAALFNTILINVTYFFRDPHAWESVSNDVVPAILAAKGRSDPIRVWSAGCASGEEAYSLAMILAEALDPDEFRDRVKIYATDVDEDALTHARHAIYSARQLEAVPDELAKKYFEPSNGQFVFRADVRRSVIFGRHDLIQDVPISRIDLLACRNTLMYFNAEIQAKILARFYFALNSGGYLMLGKAEMPFNQSAIFVPVDLKRRLFRAVPKMRARERLLLLAQAGNEEPAANGAAEGSASAQLRQAAFETDASAQIVVDETGIVLLVTDQARRLFGVGARDLGRPLQDLELCYRPAELRPSIDQALLERRAVLLKNVEAASGPGELRYYDVTIAPLLDASGTPLGTKISFADVTRYKTLQDELQHSKQELETAYEELQSTNEELETTNEELQSTVEELETTNEELQSTNEELETMNEELQSTNEELQAMNEELRTRSGELVEVNSFLSAVLTGLHAAVIVVNPQMQIQEWNRRAEDFWGLREEEVRGAHLLNLDIGLPVQELKNPVRASLSGETTTPPLVIEAINRRGRPFSCRVTCSPLVGDGGAPRGAIIVMEEEPLESASSQS